MRFASVIAGAEKVWRMTKQRAGSTSFFLGMAFPFSNLTFPFSTSNPHQQAPMSKMEPNDYLNDRYAAMEERLAVSWRWREGKKALE